MWERKLWDGSGNAGQLLTASSLCEIHNDKPRFHKPFSEELGGWQMELVWLLRGTSGRQSSGVSHSLCKKWEVTLGAMTSK